MRGHQRIDRAIDVIEVMAGSSSKRSPASVSATLRVVRASSRTSSAVSRRRIVWLSAARDDVELVLTRDPKLSTPRGQALRQLLYLFERDEAIRLISAG